MLLFVDVVGVINIAVYVVVVMVCVDVFNVVNTMNDVIVSVNVLLLLFVFDFVVDTVYTTLRLIWSSDQVY